MNVSTQILSDIIVYMKYARYLPNEKRRETWEEIINRNKGMHLKKFPQLKDEIEEAYKYVYDKRILPSMRGLQFGGKPIELNPVRQFNCAARAIDSPDVFCEIMFLLLSGCGVGYSVQRHHIEKLPEIIKPKKKRRFLVGDSAEGWCECVNALIQSYMGARKSLPIFDYSDVRPQGMPLKTSGGISPGPAPLKTAIHHVQTILDRKEDGTKLTPLEVHDIVCHLSDCVLSGGIRRSSLLSLFSFDDEEMLTCKFDKWYEINPQRARANNSAMILRHRITEDEFKCFFEKIKASQSGEPGIFFSNDAEMLANACSEVSLKASGGFCNLVEVNADIDDQEEFNRRVRMAARIATIQAAYTDFHLLSERWKDNAEEDALIGVGLTGIGSGKIFNVNLKEAANIVKEENKRMASILKINIASRQTVVKPAGTSSLVMGSSSGIHSWHSPYYIRRVRVNKIEPIYKYLKESHPELLEDDIFKPTTQAIISIPIKAPEGSLFRNETALRFLERIKRVYINWVLPGHIKGNNTNNISATVSIKKHEWDRVGEWLWKNRNYYNAISVLPYDDHTYQQAPFEEITEEEYNERIKELKKIDLTKIVETEDKTTLKENLACSNGQCEIV